jgi:hypothetical protein
MLAAFTKSFTPTLNITPYLPYSILWATPYKVTKILVNLLLAMYPFHYLLFISYLFFVFL